MGSHSKKSGSSGTPQSSYGGSTMSTADANAQYQQDLANWRAPTASGATTAPTTNAYQTADAGTDAATGHLGVPTTTWAGSTGGWGSQDAGPALPSVGVMPTAPVATANRNTLAQTMYPSSNIMGFYNGQAVYGTPQGTGNSSNRSGSSGYGHW